MQSGRLPESRVYAVLDKTRFMEGLLVSVNTFWRHEPRGRDAFHRVPILLGDVRDGVESVPTCRFMGSLDDKRVVTHRDHEPFGSAGFSGNNADGQTTDYTDYTENS